jgi:hypothetical protein
MYVPNNTPVYLRAFTGFMAGITSSATSDTSAGDYTLAAQMADAYAQQIDTEWGATAPTNLELDLIEEASSSIWTGRTPPSSDVALIPGTYTQTAQAIIARVQQGNTQVVSEGIDPNATGGGGGGGGATEALIYRPGGPSAGNVVATWAQVKTALIAANGLLDVAIDDSIVSPVVIPGASGATNGFGAARIIPYAPRVGTAFPPVVKPVLRIAEGATLHDFAEIQGPMTVEVECTATAAMSFDYNSLAGGGPLDFVSVANVVQFKMVTGALVPAIQVPADSGLFLLCSLAISFDNTAAPTVPFLHLGGLPGSPSVAQIAAAGQFLLNGPAIGGGANNQLLFSHDDESPLFTSALFLGTLVDVRLSQAQWALPSAQLTGNLPMPPNVAVGQLNYTPDATPPQLQVWDGAAWVAAGGGVVTGPPNAVAFYDGAGNSTGNASFLTSNAQDAFGRPGVHDFRLGGGGRGAVYRLGAWGVDGDPENVVSEGYITYGASANGIGPIAGEGGFGFYEPNGFGELNVIPGVNGGNSFYLCGFEDGSVNAPFGLDGFIVNTNLNTPIFWVQRSTGFTFFGQSITDHGSAARVQLSSLITSGAQFRANQYGANTGAPGFSAFKSRGTTIGALVGVLPGDPLFRVTCVGVASDDASIPLAAFITIQVPSNFVPAGQAWTPSEYELQLVPLAGPINSRRVVFKVTSEGETQTLRGVRAGGPATLPTNLSTGTLWSSGSGSPNGVVVGSPGDLYTNTAGGASTTLWVKESGAATNTGWVGK